MAVTEHRVSVSFPEGYYRAIRRIADQNDVSVAWVVRQAVRQYVDHYSPLFNEIEEHTDEWK